VNLQSLLDWLTQLPPTTLLAAMALLAALENIFPPIPADVLIAFGGFVAARSHSSPIAPFLAVLIGNMAGALGMYAVGRRLGSGWMEKKFHLKHGEGASAKLSSWYARYGVAALFLGRFVPGVRAIVTPFAGALKAPFLLTALAVTAASATWYGLVMFIAFRAGSNWEALLHTIGRLARNTGLIAAVLALLVAAVWFIRNRRAQ